ncbi:MAG: serine/threonine protein kinase [Phycisphaerae bacterium]|nr:serine/threonine protein kinase [Phycisphaerae bacterium]
MSRDPAHDDGGADDAFIAAFERSIEAAREAVSHGAGEPEIDVPPIRLDEVMHATARTTVYRGHTVGDTPAPVAVKVLRNALRFPSGLVRLEREAALLATLAHPGIATFVAFGAARDGEPFLATAFVEGPTLYAYRQSRRPAVRELVEIARDLADALAYAHQRGVLHRDASPANVVVRTTPTASRVCLLDFELARRGEDAAAPADERRDTRAPVTVEGAPFGTIGYMAPEQLAGHWSEVDVRSDVFAVGTILYELLADRLPWDVRDRSCAEAIDIMRRGPAPSVASIAREARGDLAVIVDKAIERDPEGRYPTMAALRDDLDRWLRSEPILARRPSALRVAALAIRRRPRTAALLAGALATCVVGGVAYVQAREREVAALEEAARSFVDAALEAQNLVGPTPLRRRLLSSASELTTRLVALAPDGPEAQRLRASALRAESTLAFEEREFGEARRLREAALAIATQLAARPDATPEDRRQLALSHVLIGDLARERADWHGAGAEYRRAEAIFRALHDETPGEAILLRQLACAYERRVSVADALGDRAHAKRDLDEGLAFVDDALREHPDLVSLRYERLSLRMLGQRLAAYEGDDATVLAYATASAADADAIVEHAPTNCDFRRARASIQHLLATRANGDGRADDAREHLRVAIADLEYLVNVDPHRAEWLGPLCLGYAELIGIESDRGNPAAREVAIRRARDLLAILQADAERNPDFGAVHDYARSAVKAIEGAISAARRSSS